jgi:hypothetical protein
MENREQQILSEIKQLMNSVRLQLEQLDTKMAELQQIYDPQEFESEPIDLGVFPLDLDGDVALSVETEEVTEEATENVAEEVAAFESEPETVEEPEVSEEPEAVVEPEVEDEDLPVEAEEEEPVGDSLFMSVEETPTTIHQQVQSAAVQTAVIDVMAKKHAWRSDRPGTPVKDIRAAIALVDRALFINRLFGEDAMKFMDTLNHINQMSNLDEAVEYLASAYPEWDFDSDVVYRFMMAVRRKIN